MSEAAVSPDTATGVVIAACSSSRRGEPAGSDAALLAALASGRHRDLLVVRSGLWSPDTTHLGGCRIRVIRPPVGQPWAGGPAVRRRTGPVPVPVWAEPGDLASLRGFARAAVCSEAIGEGNEFFGSLRRVRAARLGLDSDRRSDAEILVLGSHPSRLDARGIVFTASLAAVSGQPVRVVLPRGTRNMNSGRRYARRLDLTLSLDACDGPSWLETAKADVVLLDREFESSTQFGPSLIALAEALGKPIVDLPGTLPVGGRNARRYGQPLLEALDQTLGQSGATVPAA